MRFLWGGPSARPVDSAGPRPAHYLLTRRRRRRRGLRHVLPAMAGVARHVYFAVREALVDVAGHLQHLARGQLLRLIVERVVALHMAEIASLSERDGEGAH